MTPNRYVPPETLPDHEIRTSIRTYYRCALAQELLDWHSIGTVIAHAKHAAWTRAVIAKKGAYRGNHTVSHQVLHHVLLYHEVKQPFKALATLLKITSRINWPKRSFEHSPQN